MVHSIWRVTHVSPTSFAEEALIVSFMRIALARGEPMHDGPRNRDAEAQAGCLGFVSENLPWCDVGWGKIGETRSDRLLGFLIGGLESSGGLLG